MSRFLIVLVCLSSFALAGEDPTDHLDPQSQQRAYNARRAAEHAAIQAQLFQWVNYPLAIKRLDGEIKLAEAEIAMHQKLVTEYERYGKFIDANPMLVSLLWSKQNLLEAQIRLDLLKEQKALYQQYQPLAGR